MRATNTQLRYIRSKDCNRIIEYLEKVVSYKVEIKGNPLFAQGKWYLWFIIPEDLMQEMTWGDLDI